MATSTIKHDMGLKSYTNAISSLIGGTFTRAPFLQRFGDIVIISGSLTNVDFIPNSENYIFQIADGNRPKEEIKIMCMFYGKDTGTLYNDLLTIRTSGKAILSFSNVLHVKEVMFYGAYIAETPS